MADKNDNAPLAVLRTGETIPGIGPQRGIVAPAAPPIRHLAVQWMLAQVGRREESRNDGAVCLDCKEGLTTTDLNKPVLWCAYAVGQGIRQGLIQRRQMELLDRWAVHHRERPRLFSASCNKLWQNMRAMGWAWERGEELPAQFGGQPGLIGEPAYGDMQFYGQWRKTSSGYELDLHHVGMFIEPIGTDGKLVRDVSGNTADEKSPPHTADCVATGARKLSTVFGWARYPY